MIDKELLKSIRQDLEKHIDKNYHTGEKSFFKEKVISLGVRTPMVRKIAARYFKEIKDKNKKEIFVLCEELLKNKIQEEATIAYAWAFKLKKDFEKKDFKIFERWLKKYVSNWAKCDDFCGNTFGHFLHLYPEFFKRVFEWTKSRNRWLRRASAVILIYSVRRKNILAEVFKVCRKLLKDEDDLVQKGYGWLLKETSNIHQKQVFEFVMQNKKKMPRTALRYAIEKMPKSLKEQTMGK